MVGKERLSAILSISAIPVVGYRPNADIVDEKGFSNSLVKADLSSSGYDKIRVYAELGISTNVLKTHDRIEL